MTNFSTFVGIIGTLFGIVVGLITIAEKRNISKKAFAIIITILIFIIGAGAYFSTSTTITPHAPTNPFNSSSANSVTPTLTPSSTPSPTLEPTATSAPTQALSDNPNNPKLPLTLECVSSCTGYMEIVLKSIATDTTSGNIMWSFFITNKSGTRCGTVRFNDLYLTTPNNITSQPTNTIDSWSMDINQTVEQDAFFASFKAGIRYTLHFGVGYACDNMINFANESYRLYDFYFQ